MSAACFALFLESSQRRRISESRGPHLCPRPGASIAPAMNAPWPDAGIKYAAPTAAADEDELPTEQPSEAYRDLAEYWAPTMYQDVNTIYLTRSDIPTPFSCDGDWNGGSNRCYVL